MSRPSDIPEDVWDEAWGAEAWARPHYAPQTSEADKTAVVEAIARAILAERERWAKYGLDRARQLRERAAKYEAEGDEASQVSCLTSALEAMDIAAAIRKGGE